MSRHGFGMALWTLIYGGVSIMVWATAGGLAMLTFLSGLAFAVLALVVADKITRDR